jgi:hypothetical protein
MSPNRLRSYDFNDLTPPLKSLSRSPERLRVRPPVQLGLSLPYVRRRRKRPGFEGFQRFVRLLRSQLRIGAPCPPDKTDRKGEVTTE